MRSNDGYKNELKKRIDAFLPYTDKTNIVNKNRVRSFLEIIIDQQVLNQAEPLHIDVKTMYAHCAHTMHYDDALAKVYKSLSSIENNCGTMAKIANTQALKNLYGASTANELHIGYTNLKVRLRTRLRNKASIATHPPQNPPQNPSTSVRDEIQEDDYTRPLEDHEIPQEDASSQNEARAINAEHSYPIRKEFYKNNTHTENTSDRESVNSQVGANTRKTLHILPQEGLRALNLLKEWSIEEKLGDNHMVAQIIDTFIFSSMYTMDVQDA